MAKPKVRISHYTTKNIPVPEKVTSSSTIKSNSVEKEAVTRSSGVNNQVETNSPIVNSKKVKTLSKIGKERLNFKVESQYASRPLKYCLKNFHRLIKIEAQPFRQIVERNNK